MRIAVVGGGMSGLAAALRLHDICAQRGVALQITLYEADNRLGGCVHTLREQDLVMEAGADSLLVDKPWGVRLLQRLGLEDQLVPVRAEYRGALILRRGKLRPLPPDFRLFSPRSLRALARSGLFTPGGLIRAAIEPLVPPRRSDADESLASFVTRRFGREVLDVLAQPLIGGIYSADPSRLSMEATLPQFSQLERRYGSVTRGLRLSKAAPPAPKLMSLQGGLGRIVEAIDAQLRGVERVRERAVSLRALREGHDGVICAVPAYASAEIVREMDRELAGLLDRIRYNSIATVNVAYERRAIPDLPRAQGFIVPFVERRRIVAATIASQKYPGRSNEDVVLLRAFVGGALQPDLVHRSDAELEVIAREEFADLLGVRAKPRVTAVRRSLRLLPEYGVGHIRLVTQIEERTAALGRIALAGSAYHGVGLPDCIHSGEVAAERLLGII